MAMALLHNQFWGRVSTLVRVSFCFGKFSKTFANHPLLGFNASSRMANVIENSLNGAAGYWS